jgi:SAM-dependent methyltransferase
MNPQRLLFGVLYRIGITPWDDHKLPAPLVTAIAKLPSGAALDLGCGTGNAAIHLAQHGWTVTGVDLVDYALERAQRKARRTGVQVRFLRGDALCLGQLGLGRFQLLCDLACFHGIPDERRDDFVREVSALADPGAYFFLAGLSSYRKRPGPRGFDRAEIEQRFGADWEILGVTEDDAVFRMHGGDRLQFFELRRR